MNKHPIKIVITGGPGFGKSSIINQLETMGYRVFHEISRDIIKHQQQTGGSCLPWLDHHAFNDAVFQARKKQYDEAKLPGEIYFFDRGLPDSLAYLLADEKEIPEIYFKETRIRRYYPVVFLTPPWKEIYQKDSERWEEYSYATKVHDNIRAFYGSFGYELVDIPFDTVNNRVRFILERLKDHIHPIYQTLRDEHS
jgi:predicted ATPase